MIDTLRQLLMPAVSMFENRHSEMTNLPKRVYA
jgi:hypothetical protein